MVERRDAMTEGEYIRVGNLARVRAAFVILEQVRPDQIVSEAERNEILLKLDALQEKIAKTIKTMEEKKDDDR
jgi:hypothetical protein